VEGEYFRGDRRRRHTERYRYWIATPYVEKTSLWYVINKILLKTVTTRH